MKKNLILISVCLFAGFVGGLGGANITPILTGTGFIKFPENATPATLNASSGALTVASGGSNQNLNLNPSGTGTDVITATSAAPAGGGTNGHLALITAGNAFGLRAGAFDTNYTWIQSYNTLPLLIDSLGNNVGVGGTNHAFPLDVTGDINTSGVYRKGGATAGTGSSITVCTSGACATSCTLIFNGGIRTGGTCP